MGLLMFARMLLKQGLPLRGHDESRKSLNQGNFREFRTFTAEQNPTLKKAVNKKKSDKSFDCS
jgi:hypothetical protein